MLEDEERSHIFFYALLKLPYAGILFSGITLGSDEIGTQAVFMTATALVWAVTTGEIMTNNERRQWGLATDRKWAGLFAMLLMTLAIVLTVSAFTFVTEISSEAAWRNVVRGLLCSALAAPILLWWPTKNRSTEATKTDDNDGGKIDTL